MKREGEKKGWRREAEAGIESHHCLLSICVHTSLSRA